MKRKRRQENIMELYKCAINEDPLECSTTTENEYYSMPRYVKNNIKKFNT
jgi:hypothetical protein